MVGRWLRGGWVVDVVGDNEGGCDEAVSTWLWNK